MKKCVSAIENEYRNKFSELVDSINNNFENLSHIENDEERKAEMIKLSVDILNKPAVEIKNNESVGKKFEKTLCEVYRIDYTENNKNEYGTLPEIKERLLKLKEIFPHKLRHTGPKVNEYDFIGVDDTSIGLSAKTTMNGEKVCPQVIGQPSKKSFCEHFGLDESSTVDDIKRYIVDNVNSMLIRYSEKTFHCPIIYYNQKSSKLLFIKLKNEINWNEYVVNFTHLLNNKPWNESSTISINGDSLGEFQVHRGRDGVKFRWQFKKLLQVFSDNFEIIEL